MTRQLKHIATMVLNQPLLCTPEYAETVASILGERIGLNNEGMSVQNKKSQNKSWELTDSGTVIYPIVGGLVHRGSSLDAVSGLNSYTNMRSEIEYLVENPDVKNILLEIDSGGGSVAGAFDFRDYILSLRGKKPVYAIAQDSMGSAAYLVGSACEKLYVTQTGSVGSIGVVAMHTDQSEKNRELGVKPTFIYAGAYKTAGNPHEPLEGKSLEYMQESVNDSYEMFVSKVAEARGLDPDVIKSTEARMYRGQKAVDIGLADQVASMEEALNFIAGANSANTIAQGGKLMGEVIMEATDGAEDLQNLKAENERLRKSLIDNGFVIKADSVEKKSEEEKIEVADGFITKADVPESVWLKMKADAESLEAAEIEKADVALTKKAEETLPHFSVEAAKGLLSAVSKMDEVDMLMEALAAADKAFADKMEEFGKADVDGEFSSASDKVEHMVKSHMEEHGLTKKDYAKAYAAVAKTEEGKSLIAKAYKGE